MTAKYDVRATSRINEYYFCDDTAQTVVDFFEKFLVHIKGSQFANQPLILEPWQREFLVNLCAWKSLKDHTRRFREAYAEIARKNGKSTICAGIGLYLLYGDKEDGAEIYSAASDRTQAGIVFDVAKEMVLRSPTLSAMSDAFKSSIVYPRRASSYKAISAEAYSKHGFNAHGIIFDELHAQPNRDLYDVLLTSTGSRFQPLMVSITTAGFDKETICYEKHSYAKKILESVIDDPTFYPLIFAADPEDDWTAEETWKKANPNFGISISADYLKKECEKAQVTPGYENTFKRLHLNLWTEQEDRWLSTQAWDACYKQFTFEELAGRQCWAGLDLSSTLDVTALSLIFPEENGDYLLITRFWIPEESIHLRKNRDRIPYDVWEREGYLTATEGSRIDYGWIRNELNEIAKVVNIREIAIDRWNADQLATQLEGDGHNVILFGQGFGSMSSPSKEFETLVTKSKIKHNGNKVMNWMISNVAKEENPEGHIKPSKKRSKEKIDGVVSTIMALGRCSLFKDEDNVYDERGFLEI
jgi:phage terminase large subunit-like protein